VISNRLFRSGFNHPGHQHAPDNAISQLERLGAFKAQGILTDEKFAAQKAKLLGA
jgi:hypothetical protein